MKTKNLFTTICGGVVLAATTAAGATAPARAASGPLEAVYEDFARSGVFDLELSNTKANEVVSQGLFSGNPRLVRLTLEAMGAHALTRGAAEPVVERNFAAVPQLKGFLTAHWHTKLAEEGGILGLADQDVIAGHVREALVNGDNPWVAMVTFIPDLSIIPRVLASNFPGDEDVYELLWEFHSLIQAAPQADGWMLRVFNEGRFKTLEVDQLRIDSIDADDMLTFLGAAKGLAMSRPQRGLEPLVSALLRNNDDLRERHLVNALVAYGPEAIPLLDKEGLEHISSKIYTGTP